MLHGGTWKIPISDCSGSGIISAFQLREKWASQGFLSLSSCEAQARMFALSSPGRGQRSFRQDISLQPWVVHRGSCCSYSGTCYYSFLIGELDPPVKRMMVADVPDGTSLLRWQSGPGGASGKSRSSPCVGCSPESRGLAGCG